MKKYICNTKSFKYKLIGAFILSSVFPIILINIFAYYNSAKIVRENMDELTLANLQQTTTSLDLWLDSYADILFQVYTDDEIVGLIDMINNGQDVAVSKNQLRKTLRGLFYTKEYIKSISIIADNGTIVFYDQLTASNTENSWISNFNMTKDEIYNKISADNKTHIFSTQKATTFASETYYLFHIGHRIIDYKEVEKKNGVVIVSIDERLLREVCATTEENNENGTNSFNFIVDKEGYVVSYLDSSQLCKKIVDDNLDLAERNEGYRKFANENLGLDEQYTSSYTYYDEKFGWDIVNVSNQSKVIERLKDQQKILIVAILSSLIAVITIILILTKHLTGSIQKVIRTMKRAGKGELSARVEIDRRMPLEIEVIAIQFNKMLEKVEDSIKKEKNANKKQKNAEIKALEAHINPHFLYNTLDTINWMAIDEDKYEISNAINALATILRYGIDNSNGIVTVREEIDWLKKYIFLQQTRLKSTFQCDIHIEPDVLECRIHKLLLQPFVENAILHGFDGAKREHKLFLEIKRQEEKLVICIRDNGKGMDSHLVNNINNRNFTGLGDKNHIGMENAITRIQMYYDIEAEVKINSVLGEGTEILIFIPMKENG